MKLCLGLLLITLLGAVSVSADSTSPSAARRFHVQTMFKANWFKAFHYCIQNNMRLATIHSAEDIDQLNSQINATGFRDNFYIGCSKLGNEPNFYWMGYNTPITVNNWENGDPSPCPICASCVEVLVHKQMKWQHSDCYGQNYFVCESDI